jgi:hypothetical protein
MTEKNINQYPTKLLIFGMFDKIILIQHIENGLKYCIYENTANKYQWYQLDEGIKKSELISLIDTKIPDYSQLILLPDNKQLDLNASLLVSTNLKEIIIQVYPELEKQVWEVNETINKKGQIVHELSEPEINKALKFVFKLNSKQVYLALSNSIFNKRNENTLKNLLHSAGYNALTSNHLL